ncbi:MAG TPA: quinone-dependent dihydroorotate dehydrogenase [Methyloceanibacter sp.]
MSGLFDVAQAFLQALDPERAHELAIKSLELGIYPRSGPDDPGLAQDLWGLHFPNPVGMAAGFDKDARVPGALLAAGFGFVEMGTLTPLPQSGNPRPRIFRSASDGALINRLGFNSEGHNAALARLWTRPPGIIGINLGANRESKERIEDYVRGIECLTSVASYFAINISSPNTPGLRDLQAPEALDALLRRARAALKSVATEGKSPPLLVKLAPDLTDDDLPEIVRVIVANGVDGIIVSNTTLARDCLRDAAFAGETGGLSGRPLFARSTRMLARVYQLAEGKLPLVGVGGISSGEDALAKIEAGASLLQLYTGLVFEGIGLVGRIKRTLLDAIECAKIDTLSPLIGRRAGEWAER